MTRLSQHGKSIGGPVAGVERVSSWGYIYSCGHSGQACFPDLLRFRSKVAKSLFELQVIGVLWMHGVIVMCFVLAPGRGIAVILVFFSFPGTLNISASFGTSACLHSIPDEAVAIEFIPT